MANHFDITQIGFLVESEVIIKQNDEDNCIDIVQHFNAINIEFLTEPEIKKPKLATMEILTSHTQLKKSNSVREIVHLLNVRLKVNLPNEIEAMVGLLPRFVSRKLSIENSNWISSKRKDEIIQLDISNRHFCNTINTRKNKNLNIINQKSCDKIVTTYNIYNI